MAAVLRKVLWQVYALRMPVEYILGKGKRFSSMAPGGPINIQCREQDAAPNARDSCSHPSREPKGSMYLNSIYLEPYRGSHRVALGPKYKHHVGTWALRAGSALA